MTPQTQFTPGPWSINPRNNPDWHIEAETGYRVATVYMGDSVDRDEFTQANACLIASAPSLYAALQAVLDDHDMLDNPDECVVSYSVIQKVAAAIEAVDLGSSTPR